MDNNFNIDNDTMNKLNNMLQNGDVSKLMSNIPPEMLEKVSSIIGNSNNNIGNNSSATLSDNGDNSSNTLNNNYNSGYSNRF